MSSAVFPNIPRLFTALAEWLACMVYISHLPQRRTGARLWAAALPLLAVQCLWLHATGTLPVLWWIPCMAAAVALMFLLFALCCDISLPAAGYCTARAFLLAELAASLEWQLYHYTATHLELRSELAAGLILAAVYAAVFLLAWWLEGRHKEAGLQAFRLKELWSPVLIGLTAFLMSNLSFVYSDTPFSGTAASEIYNIRTLMDLAGVITLYAYHAQRGELFMRREVDAIQNILKSQYAQYRQSQESIDLINRKYHDLKHQIAVLRAEQDPQRRADFLDAMDREIRSYEAQNKTGSSVLDTILTGKSLTCSKNRIELTCVANGALLDFMDVMDLCTLFGNALDNAIEHELTIADPEKRMIRMSVSEKRSFLVIQVENYLAEAPLFQGGLPVTTKGDRSYHGYGLKSIRYTAEKYGGTLTLKAEDHWFSLIVLIPLS